MTPSNTNSTQSTNSINPAKSTNSTRSTNSINPLPDIPNISSNRKLHIRFSKRLLRWYDRYGRHDLPWQRHQTPYAVWVSEIMLQQTQVSTVIPYFERFMSSFPSIKRLAESPLDAILAHWSGLGYYARARHLHQTAQILMTNHNGHLPADLTALQTLPGIGRSTAGAILSLGYQQPAAILDGNVKRVLARFYAIDTWPGATETLKQLWHLAEIHTPSQRTADYNQAMMDLGATCCTRKQPDCHRCPIQSDCLAYQRQLTAVLPRSKPKLPSPERHQIFLLLVNEQNELLLEQRPETGLWGGLWCFPNIPTPTNLPNRAKLTHPRAKLNHSNSIPATVVLKTVISHAETTWGYTIAQHKALTPFSHTFSHFKLHIFPIVLWLTALKNEHADHQLNQDTHTSHQVWYTLGSALPGGIPKPVAKLLDEAKAIL